MNELHLKNKEKMPLIKDKSKGQRIITAIHMVVAHLPDTLALKTHLLEVSVLLVREHTVATKKHHATTVVTLLESAVMLGFVSEKNASIIIYETNRFVSSLGDLEVSLPTLFAPEHTPFVSKNVPQKSPLTVTPVPENSDQSKRQTSVSILKEVKTSRDNRKDEILSFINSRTATSIKDITTLFPNLSEKTIQRELVSLVASNLIVKKGDKRWSTYLPVHL